MLILLHDGGYNGERMYVGLFESLAAIDQAIAEGRIHYLNMPLERRGMDIFSGNDNVYTIEEHAVNSFDWN